MASNVNGNFRDNTVDIDASGGTSSSDVVIVADAGTTFTQNDQVNQINLGSGNDKLTITDANAAATKILGNISTDFGEDVVTVVNSEVDGSISTAGSDDVVSIAESTIGGNLTTDHGEEEVNIVNSTIKGFVDTGSSADDVTITGSNIGGALNTGSGEDDVVVEGSTIGGNLDTGSASDEIDVSNTTINGSLLTGSQSDTAILSATKVTGNVDTADGSDVVGILDGSTVQGQMFLGSQQDELTVLDSTVSKNISLSSGIDKFTVSSSSTIDGIVDGGSQNDVFGITGDFTLTDSNGTVVTHTGDDHDTGYTLDTGSGPSDVTLAELNTAISGGTVNLDLLFTVNLGESGDTFQARNFDSFGFTNLVCFAEGTRIDTKRGPVAVEELSADDQVKTLDGSYKDVLWVGRQTVSSRFGPADRLKLVRITKGALSENVPSEDLTVTMDHGVLVDGVICHAGALINSESILAVSADELPEVYRVFHVETAEHEIIFSHGVTSETFIDNVERQGFDNYDEFEAKYGQVEEMEALPYPRAMSSRQVPASIKARLGLQKIA